MKENNKEILNDDERKQLGQIVKVLTDNKIKVRWIKKVKNLYKPTEHKEHILIYYAEPADTWFADLTDFEEGTRYKGMEEAIHLHKDKKRSVHKSPLFQRGDV